MEPTEPPHLSSRCCVCGEPVRLRYWVADYPRLVHHECRDWSSARWPFAAAEAALRRLRRPLGALLQRERRQLASDLARARRAWPDAEARQTYETLASRLGRLRVALGTAGIERSVLRGL
ncbi:MAG: hypothetical protein H6722_24145 [Sandaracinus sp.]|nr:hypothetical protein [Sandaracinus sp.]MCB9615534.1 hypothetical protein [Sandaracinus sp.]